MKRSIKKTSKTAINTFRVIGKSKIFCIGLNKTGTTSLKKEMENQGYIVGNQRQAELLFDDWIKRDFGRLVRYCRTAQFFQDVPFGLPYTFIALDQAYPGSKFILTVRDDAEQWYNSLIRFHGKLWGNGNIPPTSEDLKRSTYIYKGLPFHYQMNIYNVDEENPYDKDTLIDFYQSHNKNVINYFLHRFEDLLVVNVKKDKDYVKFCDFIGVVQKNEGFPWENKT